MSIEVINLTHTYDIGMPYEKTAVSDVTLSIPKASITGIIGSTGSGKSTMIQHFNALLNPTSGKVLVDGVETTKYDKKSLRKKVGLVFQYPETQLFGETIFQDIAFGPQKQGLKEAEVREKVIESMKMVGLDPEKYSQRSPFKLSGGEKRKVAIAGILACHTEILVLDEPTAGLDPVSRFNFLELIKGFKREGHTLIMVSHDMDEIARICENVIILSKSKLIFSGDVNEAFSRPDLIEKAGLDVPALSLIAQKLRDKGFDVPKKMYNSRELCEVVKGQVKL